MNNRGAKQLLFGIAITLFSLMLVFAGFVFLLLDAVPYLINAGFPIGREVHIIIWLAIAAGIGGMFVAWSGLNRND